MKSEFAAILTQQRGEVNDGIGWLQRESYIGAATMRRFCASICRVALLIIALRSTSWSGEAGLARKDMHWNSVHGTWLSAPTESRELPGKRNVQV